jgi:hypothetical protein
MAEQIIPAKSMLQVTRGFERIVAEDEQSGCLAKYRALAESLWVY